MARVATDDDFNNASRYLDTRLDIYFTSTPLTVSKTDYLIDADWLEEGSAESSNPFGVISSNELSFRLFNKHSMFSPTNPSGPYYGLIKSGVKVVLYIRPLYDNEEVEWVELGTYYVTGWHTQVTGAYADVVANDEWYDIFNSPDPNYPIEPDTTYYRYLTGFFNLLGFNVDVDPALNRGLEYGYVEGSIKDFMQEFTAASLSYVTSSKNGRPRIGALTNTGPVRATLTDANQIITVTSKQSITRAYDGVELTYSVPQISAPTSLVRLNGQVFTQGINEISNVALKGPLLQVAAANIKSTSNAVLLNSYHATQWLITLFIECLEEYGDGDIEVFGKVLNNIDFTLADDSLTLFTVANRYIQTQAYAKYYKSILNAFVNSNTPLLSLEIRGNPLLNIGDKVLVSSAKYNLTYSGIIQRMDYRNSGGLRCNMTLLNTNIIQGVRV